MMKMMKNARMIQMISYLILSVLSMAQIPQAFNFQGILKDADGLPVNDTKFMEFRIYSDATGGTLLWSEQHIGVNIADGLFAVTLGENNAFPNNNFFNGYPKLYITFVVGGEEMLPRQKLNSVPFSLRTKNAEYANEADEAALAFYAIDANQLDGKSSEDFVQQDAGGNATITGTMTADTFVGDGSALTNLPPSTDNDWIENGNYVYTLNDSVGIGTASPAAPLDVYGHIYQSGTGGSVFVGQEAGKNDDFSNNRNVFVGYQTGIANTNGYWNNIIGTQSFWVNENGRGNNALGYRTLFSNIDGNNNTAIGGSALYLNSSGDYNIGLGYYAAYNNTTGENNIAIGSQSLYNNTTGYSNIAIGVNALKENTEINNLLAIGDSALFNNGIGAQPGLEGKYNLAVGSKTLYANTTGFKNTAIGFEAATSNTTGESNTALGYKAMQSTTTGDKNVAIGEYALVSNTYGSYNVAVGGEALGIGNNSYSVAIGYKALRNSTMGSQTACGYEALSENTTGQYNSAFGMQALANNTSGSENTALGDGALESNIAGESNTGIGFSAGNFNQYGNNNCSVGYFAMRINNYGNNNTAVGNYAMFGFSGGDYNTAIGNRAYNGDAYNPVNYDNSTAIGYYADITNNNQVRIGNSSVTSIGGYTSWSNLSDGRFKQNVQENVPGLDFIMQLRPVTYNLDVNKLNDFLHVPDSVQNVSKLRTYADEKAAIQYTGFIAQEVEEVADRLGFDFSGVDKPQNEESHYSLRYAEFVVPLVQAVQEQQQIIDNQNQKISTQKTMILDLLKRVEQLEQGK
jgi:hypothetical protein